MTAAQHACHKAPVLTWPPLLRMCGRQPALPSHEPRLCSVSGAHAVHFLKAPHERGAGCCWLCLQPLPPPPPPPPPLAHAHGRQATHAHARGPAGRMRGAAQLRRPRSGDAGLRVRVRCRLGDGGRPGRARGGRRRRGRVLLAGRRGRRARRALCRVPPCSSRCSSSTFGRMELGAPLPHVLLLCFRGRLDEAGRSSRARTVCGSPRMA